MSKQNPLVIVLARNYATGLSVIRSLGAAGYTVDLIASAPKAGASEIAARSKYVRKSTEVVASKTGAKGRELLIDEILKYAFVSDEKPVLFPTDDYTTSIVDQSYDVLEQYFLMPHIVGGTNGAITERMDKTVQTALAKEAGLKTPKEWIFALNEEIVIPEEMIYPCFCKPIESVTGFKKEMKACNNERQLLSHLNKLRKRNAERSILVQEFLQIDNEIDLSGVCIDEQIIIPAVIQKTHVAQYEKGVTLSGKLVSFETMGELQEKIVTMLKKFHYVGMFDMEFNIVGDEIYFNEVNLRSGGPNYSYFKSGINLPALVVNELAGNGHTPEEEVIGELGKSFIYEKVAWEDYLHGFITKKELKEKINSADITLLYNKEDPEPEKLFKAEFKKKEINYRIVKPVKSMLKRTKSGIKSWILKTLRKCRNYLYGYPQIWKKNRRRINSEKPRVLISGRNYCSNLSLARSFGEAGYDVEILRIYQKRPPMLKYLTGLIPDAYSKYIKAYYVCITHRRSRRLVKKLRRMADHSRKMLLIPADDLVASIVDENYNRLSQYYVIPNVDHQEGALSRLMSKEVQMDLAREAGLPIVNSCVIRTQNGEYEIPDTVTYPCFIKPNISKNSSKSRMRKCESEEELREALTEFSKRKDIEMLVEDYLDIAREYSLLGLSTADGAISPGFFGAEEGGHGPRRGVAMIGRILSCSQQQKLIDDIVRFIETLHFEGLFDVDLIETTDGKMYFVELNLRYGASGYAVTRCGANLPGMFADYMLYNKPIDLNCQVSETNKTFISEKIAIEEYMEGYLTFSEMKSRMKSVDIQFVKNSMDKKAFRHFRRYYPIAFLMRRSIRKKMKKQEAKLTAQN